MKALISVSDKTGLIPFAKSLLDLNVEIISTGGTYRVLKEAGLAVVPIEEVTMFPEMLNGRVKTLHPNIHGGILALRDDAAHMETVKAHGIGLIDMVVVNLYPFEETISRPDVTLAEAIENIDIGGPSMIRSSAKNFRSVATIVNPQKYDDIIGELKSSNGSLSDETRQLLATEAFTHTAEYDALISTYFKGQFAGNGQANGKMPESVAPMLNKISDLRYGENPHQTAAFYGFGNDGLAGLRQLHGKDLSYNNIMDLNAAWQISKEFEQPAAAIIKHSNPCGAAIGIQIAEAYQKAHDADPVSAFGSIVGLNREVDQDTAARISQTFVEAVIAPAFAKKALEILQEKASIRLITLPDYRGVDLRPQYRYVQGGMLLQRANDRVVTAADLNMVTVRHPSAQEQEDLLFAFSLVKHVKSNAILLAGNGQSMGVGAGQMSRVEACELAIKKAGARAKGSVLASDAFFPFRDSVDLAAKAGITAIIQPGGSKRDQESVDACNAHGIAMVMTGIRHFFH